MEEEGEEEEEEEDDFVRIASCRGSSSGSPSSSTGALSTRVAERSPRVSMIKTVSFLSLGFIPLL